METILTFVAGMITGGLGQYFATRFSDKAKVRDLKKERRKEFKLAHSIMPDLFAEMFEDFKDSEKREFFVIPSRKISFNATDYVAYYQDEHKELKSKISFLVNANFITDVTETNTSKYFMTEELLGYIKKHYKG